VSFERALAIADAVLMEGYALYPYRASAPKNRFRWTLGVVAPRAWASAGGCEPCWLETQFLVAGTPGAVSGRLRFFQIERCHRDDASTWDEGIVRTVDFAIADGRSCLPFTFDGARAQGALEVRERRGVVGQLVLARDVVDADRRLSRITLRVENRTPWSEPAATRERAMIASFASTQLLVGVQDGSLLSMLDPPDWARAEALRCKHTGIYPVLVGPPGSDDLLLAAPFIMYDHPQLAPESAGDLCDATEIDELLTLRTRLLTDDEKREARATDPRTAAILDRADTLPDACLGRMHGAVRDLVAGEMVPIRESPRPGEKVRLLAPRRRTDAQDLLYAGQIATVVEVREDIDGTSFVGVTIDGDPAAELHRWYGRCHYYRMDEVEML
jgi:hypothetical protein